MQNKLSAVVLISGNGSNLQAIIDAISSNLLKIEIKTVISSNPTAKGLQRAITANIPTKTYVPKEFKDRDAFDAALADYVSEHSPQLVILAGFMQILGKNFLKAHKNKIINIHPSLLPLYPGLNTHELAIADGALEHGCSIHFVNEHLDAGPLIAQASFKVKQTDTLPILKDKVHKAEHFLYPTVINWFGQGRLKLQDGQVFLDDVPTPPFGFKFVINPL